MSTGPTDITTAVINKHSCHLKSDTDSEFHVTNRVKCTLIHPSPFPARAQTVDLLTQTFLNLQSIRSSFVQRNLFFPHFHLLCPVLLMLWGNKGWNIYPRTGTRVVYVCVWVSMLVKTREEERTDGEQRGICLYSKPVKAPPPPAFLLEQRESVKEKRKAGGKKENEYGE